MCEWILVYPGILLKHIYSAHKAVYPEQFPIRDTTRALYPALYGIEERFKGKPTPVHLQLYDGMYSPSV